MLANNVTFTYEMFERTRKSEFEKILTPSIDGKVEELPK